MKGNGRKRLQTLYYFIAVLIPVVFFVLLEVALRIVNYGSGYPQWVSPVKGTCMLNPDIARKYFHNVKELPSSNGDVFDEEKKNRRIQGIRRREQRRRGVSVPAERGFFAIPSTAAGP
jgi:hypothetical protein